MSEDDVRLNLDAEVRTRLRQLGLILKKLAEETAIVTPTPEEIKRSQDFFRQHYAEYARGEMSLDEWVDGTRVRRSSMAELQREAEAFESIRLFTEAFYFFAWRLIEVLNGNGKYRFPHLERMRANGVRVVRNHLIQHPEKQGQNFNQGMVVTDSGPVLRTLGASIDGVTGKVGSADDTVDRGLYVTAAELRDEMQAKFERATAEILESG